MHIKLVVNVPLQVMGYYEADLWTMSCTLFPINNHGALIHLNVETGIIQHYACDDTNP